MESAVKKSIVFAMMTAAFAVGSAAQAEEIAKAGDASPQEEKKICRTEQVTGSRTRRNRICLTKAEWDKLAADTQKNVSDFQTRTSSTPQAPSGPFGG
jgi:hypothetical protein